MCAGVGKKDETCFACKTCLEHFCQVSGPTMAPLALSNMNWLGREQPLYQKLTLGTKLLLGKGRPVMRQIFLGPSTAKESYKGLVGNTILLAQAEAKTTQILPSLNKVLDQLVIVFTRSVEEVKTCKALTVNRAEFVDCLRLRKKHCPVFFDTDIDQDAVQKLPVEGVPNEFIEHAIHLPESTFLQRMQGPGDLPVTAPPSNTDGNIAEESDDDHEVAQADDESVHDDAPACADEGHERATHESQKSPEFMIAIDYEQDPKPAQLFQAMQKNWNIFKKKLQKLRPTKVVLGKTFQPLCDK